MRLLLIEDSDRLAGLLRLGLQRAGWAVDIVGTLAAAEEACAAGGYDAILLDRGLPDGDGLHLLRQLGPGLRRGEGPAVLVMTARGAVPDRVAGLQLGAEDYLVKPVAMEELLARLQVALRRAARPPSPAVTLGRLAWDPSTRGMTIGGAAFEPPRQERVLLEALLRAAPRPLEKSALEDRLRSLDRELGPNAVEVYVHRLRRRLEEAGAGVAIATVRGLGYRLAASDEE